MDLVLASVRRAVRRVATVVVVLYASTGVLATVSVCAPGPHRHHGVPAPDCVMHHQEGTHHGASSAGQHAGAHAAHAGHTGPTNRTTAAIKCACGAELQALHPADAAVLAATGRWVPSLIVTSAAAGLEPRIPTVDPQSSSPPPRA